VGTEIQSDICVLNLYLVSKVGTNNKMSPDMRK